MEHNPTSGGFSQVYKNLKGQSQRTMAKIIQINNSVL